MKIESINVWHSWSYYKRIKFKILSFLFRKEKESWHKFANNLASWAIKYDAINIVFAFKEATYKWWYIEDPKNTFNISWLPIKPIESVKFVCTIKEKNER
jgi:hypothetical protein